MKRNITDQIELHLRKYFNKNHFIKISPFTSRLTLPFEEEFVDFNFICHVKILFLSDNFPPEVNAPATRTFEHCKKWVEMGHEVTVVTCFPNYPQGKVYPGYKNQLRKKEVMNGIIVLRVWSFIAPNSGFFKRVVDFCSFAMMAILQSVFIKTDIIIATSPQFFTAVAGRILSVLKRRPWVMEVRDLWPESIVAVGALKKGAILSFFEFLERHLYKTARAIVVVTDSFKKKIVEMGIPHSKIFVHKNGVDLASFEPMEKDEGLVRSLGINGELVVAYFGTHGMSHNLEFVLEAARGSNQNIRFLFIGDGAEKSRLVGLAEENNLSNVTFLPPVSKKEIRKYISIADISLVHLKKSNTFKTVIPSKIFENAAMGKPILLGVEGEAKDLILKYNAGIAYSPDSQIEFCKAIDTLSNTLVREDYSHGAKSLAQDFDRNKMAAEMLETIVSIKNQK